MSNTVERRNLYPAPPARMVLEDLEDAQQFANSVQRHLSNVARYTQYRQDSLLDVLSDDIESMSVNKLTAGTLDVDKVYIGGTSFELDGLLTQLRIKDQQVTPITRVEMGIFGAGVDAGIKVRNDAGTVIFQTGTTTFIDGVIISDNTITAGKLNVTELSAIVADMGTITAGTITGALIRTSASNPRVELTSTGLAGYNAAADVIFDLTTSGTVRFGPSTGNNILWNGSTLVITGDVIATGNIQNAAITEALIAASAITSGKLATNSVIAGKIAANAVTATEINVSTLSAISGNMGTLTAGSITGGSITANAINSGTLTVDGAPGLIVTGSGNMILRSGVSTSNYFIFQNSGSTQQGVMSFQPSPARITLSSVGGVDINISAGDDLILFAGGGDITLDAARTLPGGSTNDIGTSSARFRDFYFSGTLRGDADVLLEASTGGIVRIGNGTSTDVHVQGRIAAHLDPQGGNTFDLGDATNRWREIFSNNVLNTSLSKLKQDIRDIPEDVPIPRGVIFRFKHRPERNVVGYLSDDLPKESFDGDCSYITAPIGVLCTVAKRHENKIRDLQKQIDVLQFLLECRNLQS